MERLFFLRAYGDFVIGLQQISKSNKPIKIVASIHLLPLYEALLNAFIISSLPIEFVNFGITQGQLNYFTNKRFFHTSTLRQLNLIKNYIKLHPNICGQDYIEHEIRLSFFNFFTKANCKAVVGKNKEVYESYEQFLGLEKIMIKNKKADHKKKIIIFPDARQKKKEIPAILLCKLTEEKTSNGNIVKVARLNNRNPEELSYHNFKELIDLIQSSDYIISADSLPAHIAQAIEKQHAIYYNNKVNRFCTPYVLQYKSYILTNE